jgi:hypothetical protein
MQLHLLVHRASVMLPLLLPLLQFVTSITSGKDYLGHMGDAQRTAWSHDLGYSINETLQALSEARVPIIVDVKLVSFAGDGWVLL